MSKMMDDVTYGHISDSEIQTELRAMAEDKIRKVRVRKVLLNVMNKVEALDRMCRTLLMSASDYHTVKECMGDEIDIETDVNVLRTGKMATYCTTSIIVSRGFEDGIVGVPDIPEAEDCLIALEEVGI